MNLKDSYARLKGRRPAIIVAEKDALLEQVLARGLRHAMNCNRYANCSCGADELAQSIRESLEDTKELINS